jgi:hypothetical protein
VVVVVVPNARSPWKKLQRDESKERVIESRVIHNVFTETENRVKVQDADRWPNHHTRKQKRKTSLKSSVHWVDVDGGKRSWILDRVVEAVKVAPEIRNLVLHAMPPIPVLHATCGLNGVQ